MVLRVCRAVVGPDLAEDAWSETFLAALRAFPSLSPDANIEAWLVTIAHRKAIDSHRARKRRPVPVESLDERPAPMPADGEPALWEAVRALPAKQRTSILHRYVNDLPYADIGRMVGCSEAAARQNVRAGLASLRGAWDR